MRDRMRSGAAGALAALVLSVGIVGLAGDAVAGSLTLPLTVEFDDGLTGDFGTILLEDHDEDPAIPIGDLRITIVLAADLGDDADLHDFYFNLPDSVDADGLEISDSLCDGGSCQNDFDLEIGRPVRGGAGSDFDFRVNFGNGGGPPGNGHLDTASFLLGADGPLTIADLVAESSETSAGIEATFAIHVQSTDLVRGSDSETVGTLVPEPGTAALLAFGLAGLGLAGRRGRERA